MSYYKEAQKNTVIVSIFTCVRKVRPQLVKSLVIVIRAHVVKVCNNYASTLIIYKVNRNFSFLPIIRFP